MSLRQRLTWGNSIANTSIALYLSLAISLSIYCSDSLSPSFTTDQPHHSFSSQVIVQQCVLSIYPADPICSWFMCSLAGVLLLVELAGGCDSELERFSGAAACPGHGQWPGLLLWFCLMTRSTNFSHPCSVFVLQPLHRPRVALLTQLFVGSHL